MDKAIKALELKFKAKVYEKNEESVYLSVWNWGDWEVPDDTMDDAEDCDFEVLTETSNNTVKNIISELNKEYTNVSISYMVSEKNYIDFRIKKKEK